MKKAFILIGDLIETDIELPLNLFENFYLTKASEDQVRIIKKFLDNYTNILLSPINKFESLYQRRDDSGCNISALPKENWKYFVIEHDKNQAKSELQLICLLSSLDLTVLFETPAQLRGTIHHQLRTLNFFHDDQSQGGIIPNTKSINAKSIEELVNINKDIESFDKLKFPHIEKALTDFIKVKDISKQSPFKVLSCFSILELLLTTYKPRTSDSTLSGQLKKKINLINNQLIEKIEVADFFTGPDTLTLETVFEKLYQYRNDIAHGNISKFENDLSVFRNQEKQILPFLLFTLRKTLLFSIENPQLITDLKDC